MFQLSALGDDDLAGCPALAELRLGHNGLAALPGALSSCGRLKIVDLGSNRVADLDSMKVTIHCNVLDVDLSACSLNCMRVAAVLSRAPLEGSGICA